MWASDVPSVVAVPIKCENTHALLCAVVMSSPPSSSPPSLPLPVLIKVSQVAHTTDTSLPDHHPIKHEAGGRGGGGTCFMHGRSRLTIDPRIPMYKSGTKHVGFSLPRQKIDIACNKRGAPWGVRRVA